ncbi:MAG: sigma-70 family RNA polymerase sigma factor [Thermomicrobia bacterium]|nr:sigma-70 family RNA polymerase sigma factor [Thermomicrobia bacterium]
MTATDTDVAQDDGAIVIAIVHDNHRTGTYHHAQPIQDTDEPALIERAIAGDERAFAELVGRYQTAVYNLAYRMLGDAGEAEDAAQEVFLRIYRRLATYDADHRFSTWVLSIASHYCIDLLRRKRPWLVPLENISNWMRARSRGPEAAALVQEQQDTVRTLLAKLPEHYRLVLLLRYWHDLGYEEIAQVVDLPVSTIKARLHRARNALAALVNGDGRLADALQAHP